MRYIVVGLGNPGSKYEKTRHNAGRTNLICFAKQHEFSLWGSDKRLNALVSKGEVGDIPFTLVLPETFMNESGSTVKKIIKDKAEVRERLIVVHDDLDIPIGSLKISFGRGSAGNKGVNSIVDSLGTKEFTRVRIGITPKGDFKDIRKFYYGEDAINKFVLQKFSPEEREKMKEVCEKASEVLLMIAKDGREKAMNVFH